MFRFTIRDLLWLMVVLAVALSLGTRWRHERARANELAAESDLNHKLVHLRKPLKLSHELTVKVTNEDGHVVLFFDIVKP